MLTHGHVTPNPDGSKARCGGPTVCAVCAQEAARRLLDDCRHCGLPRSAHTEAAGVVLCTDPVQGLIGGCTPSQFAPVASWGAGPLGKPALPVGGVILANHGTQIKRLRPRMADDFTEGLALEVYTDRGVGRIELDHDELQRLLAALPPALLTASLAQRGEIYLLDVDPAHDETLRPNAGGQE